MGPMDAVEAQSNGIAIRDCEVEMPARREQSRHLGEFHIGIGDVFQAVAHDDDVKGCRRQSELGDETHPYLHPMSLP